MADHQGTFDAVSQTSYVDSVDDQGRTTLHNSILVDDIELIRDLLEQGANPGIQDNDGDTPLILAARLHVEQHADRFVLKKKRDELIATLCDSKGDLNWMAQNHRGKTVFHEAAYSGRVFLFRMYFKGHGQSRALESVMNDGVNAHQLNPLQEACYRGQFSVVKCLLQFGLGRGQPGSLALKKACQQHRSRIVDLLLAEGIRSPSSDEGGTMLHIALDNMPLEGSDRLRDVVETVRVLLKWGVNPNQRDKRGSTPSHTLVCKLSGTERYIINLHFPPNFTHFVNKTRLLRFHLILLLFIVI